MRYTTRYNTRYPIHIPLNNLITYLHVRRRARFMDSVRQVARRDRHRRRELLLRVHQLVHR